MPQHHVDISLSEFVISERTGDVCLPLQATNTFGKTVNLKAVIKSLPL